MAKSKVKEPLHARDFENMGEEQTLKRVIDDLSASEAFQKPYFDKFVRYYQLYRSYIDVRDRKKDRSNLFIPYTFHIIETTTPKLVLAMFNTRPYVQTMPLGVSNNERRLERSKKMNKLLDYQFQQKVKLVPTCTDVVKATHIFGTAITKQAWDFEEKELVKKRNKVVDGSAVPNMYEAVLVKSVVKDDPKVVHIPIFDFFFDPASSTIEEGRYAIHRDYADLHELEERSARTEGKIYKNLDKLKEQINRMESSQANNGQSANPALDSIGLSANMNGKKGVELLHYWTDDWYVIVADRKYVILSVMNPYYHHKKPFAKWVDNPVPNEFYGIGEIEAIESLQHELNTTRNQRIDNVSLCINKMWKIKRAANIDTTQLVSRPAGFIEVDEDDDVNEITFSDVTSSAYNEETLIKQDIDRTTGVNDAARGTASARRETATTMNILAQASGDRFKLKTLLTEYGGFHEMVNQIIQLNQQYVDREREVLILGDNGVLDVDVITPDEIAGAWTIVGVGSAVEPVVNTVDRQTQLTQLLGMINSNPMIAQQVNMQELLKEIFESFSMKNVDRFFMQPGGVGALAMPGATPQAPVLPQLGGLVNGQ